MNYGLNDHTIEKFQKVFQKYPEIDRVMIYGSRAKGNYREGSDIDLSLMGEKITAETNAKVWRDLDDLNTPYLIDLSVFSLLTSQSLIEHIKRVGKEFYKKAALHH